MTDSSSSSNKTSISFGFKKKIESKVDESKVVKDHQEEISKEFLDHVDEETLKKEKQKKELVIPLIKKNRWCTPSQNNGQTDSSTGVDAELQNQAAKEIMKESAEFMEKTYDDHGNDFDNMAVPLLLKNKVPEGYETDDRLDVVLRPEESTLEDYDSMPVEAFGMAVIRGMGWDSEVGIGKTFKQNFKMLETTVRPKGLGLGASVPTMKRNDSRKQTSENRKKEDILEVKKGAYVLIQSGSHKNKYGIVEGMDPDNAQCLIKFALGGNSASVTEYVLKAVAKDEYLKYGKDLSRLSKAHKNTEAVLNKFSMPHSKNDNTNGREKVVTESDQILSKHKKTKKKQHDNDVRKDLYSDIYNEDYGHNQKKHAKSHSGHKKHAYDYQDKRSSSYADSYKKSSKRPKMLGNDNYIARVKKHKKTWLHSNLRVRMVDNGYKKGKYYREKLLVVDILDASGHCCCETSGGKLLDDIHEDMLETVVPRSTSDAYVMITGGKKHVGKLAKILEKNKETCEAYLQLIEDRDVALKISFDDICEYAGDIEANDMF